MASGTPVAEISPNAGSGTVVVVAPRLVVTAAMVVLVDDVEGMGTEVDVVVEGTVETEVQDEASNAASKKEQYFNMAGDSGTDRYN